MREKSKKTPNIGFQIMFLARLEGAPLSKAYKTVRRRRGATDNAVQKLYLEDYNIKQYRSSQHENYRQDSRLYVAIVFR